MTLPTNRKLEDLFDLASQDPADETHEPNAEPHNHDQASLPVMPETLVALDKIEAALPAVKGLEASDREMDELAGRAQESFDDLMNLGMQVDAITARTAKMNKKLKMIDLQMKKLKLDRDSDEGISGLPEAQGHVLDRNELLNHLLGSSAAEPSKGTSR